MTKKRVRTSGVKVSASAFSTGKKRNDVSRQIDSDDSYFMQGTSGVIEPPYEISRLDTIYGQSSMLPQCVESMKVNVASNGIRVVARAEGVEIEDAERLTLQSFIDSANLEESLSSVQGKLVHNYEKYGFGFYEVIRNRRGTPTLIKNAKSATTRLIKADKERVQVTINVARGGSRSRVKEFRTFRKYVQQVGAAKVYYKEFGDPRVMSYKTGKYETTENKVDSGDRATEILHRRQISEDAYGTPRWISQLPNILGSRESEEVNLRYFEDNTVPPILLSVSGGRLTRQSYIELKELVETQGLGRDRQNQMILIEAVGESQDIDGKASSVSVKVDKLTDARQSDGLFKEYDSRNADKVRSSFRLPPGLVGMSQEATFASNNVAMYMAETQVFVPERRDHDEFLNKRFVNHPKGLNLQTVKLESKGPTITNPDQIVKVLTAANVMGGVTPRSSIELINEAMQLSLPQYPGIGVDGYEEWMDKPITIGMREILANQQTGEGDETHDASGAKTDKIKETEEEGSSGAETEAVEHGNE